MVEVMNQDNGADFPYSNPDPVTPSSTTAAAEWVSPAEAPQATVSGRLPHPD